MKKYVSISLLMFAACVAFTKVNAQLAKTTSYNAAVPAQKKKITPCQNFVKVNLTAIALNNYSLQYERALNRKISVALSYRIMPMSSIPFKATIMKMLTADDKTKQTINDARLSNTAITPEFRFYPGRKGYGHGFYIAPFYRFATFKASNIDIFYTDNSGNNNSVKLSGKLTSNTGGILFGIQHLFGRHIVLDMQLLGPHFGSAVGNFSGTAVEPLTKDEQGQMTNSLSNLNIPLINTSTNVNANTASLHAKGSWGGIRAGLSLGVRF